MTVQTENFRTVNHCLAYRNTVRDQTDRLVVLNPSWPPAGFGRQATAEIRSGTIEPLPARVVSGDRATVRLYLDAHDSLAAGLEPSDDGVGTRTVDVEVANLLKAEVVSAIMCRDDQKVSFGEDHHGFPGTFDLFVTLRAGSNLHAMLPSAYLERHDPGRNETEFIFQAASRPLGDGVFELWLLMGGRGASAPVELAEQYRLDASRPEGDRAYAWPIYAVYGERMPSEPEVELGKVYNVRLGEPSVVLEALEDGRYQVARIDPVEDGRPIYSVANRSDLLPLTSAQLAQRDDWVDTAIAIAVNERRQYSLASRRADNALTQAREARERHERDIETIGDRLIEESESRNWCSEYDGVIDDLNPQLTVPLRERKRDYTVRVRVTYYVNVDVEARDRDAAEEIVENDRSLVMDALDTDDYDSITVTEVDEQ